jgi:ABC-type polysaccharide/polyol phosphate export permease
MTLGDSVESISGNSTLITKVRFPRIILPLSIVLANCINYALSLFVLILFLPLLGCPFTFRLLWLPALLILIFIFIMGLSLFVATCNVYFKDTPHLLSVALMAWFFLTPIIYPLTQIPERFRGPAFINPMAAVITLYRYAITGQSFDFTPWMGGGIALIFLFFILGAHIFYRYERIFADML